MDLSNDILLIMQDMTSIDKIEAIKTIAQHNSNHIARNAEAFISFVIGATISVCVWAFVWMKVRFKEEDRYQK